MGLDKLKTLDLRSSSSSLLSEDVEAAMAEAASSLSLSRSLDFFFDFFFFLHCKKERRVKVWHFLQVFLWCGGFANLTALLLDRLLVDSLELQRGLLHAVVIGRRHRYAVDISHLRKFSGSGKPETFENSLENSMLSFKTGRLRQAELPRPSDCRAPARLRGCSLTEPVVG